MDNEIFKGKSFSDLMEDIYTNSVKKEKQISALIKDLQPMIKSIGDATIIVPIIKEYLEVGVKNLIKMAAIVQRAQARASSVDDGGLLLTEEEKRHLLETVTELQSEEKK